MFKSIAIVKNFIWQFSIFLLPLEKILNTKSLGHYTNSDWVTANGTLADIKCEIGPNLQCNRDQNRIYT